MAEYVLQCDLQHYYSPGEFEKMLVNHFYGLVIGVTACTIHEAIFTLRRIRNELAINNNKVYVRENGRKLYDLTENIMYKVITPFNEPTYFGLSVDQLFVLSCYTGDEVKYTEAVERMKEKILYKSCVPVDYQICMLWGI